METVTLLAGIVLGAAAAWLLARDHAAADFEKLRSELEEQIRHWQRQARLARADASRLADQTAAWTAGCQRGRDDMLSLARALGQQTASSAPPDDHAASHPPDG